MNDENEKYLYYKIGFFISEGQRGGMWPNQKQNIVKGMTHKQVFI